MNFILAVGEKLVACISNGIPSHNNIGSKSATCGNATRCIANFLMDEIKKDEIDLSTDHKSLKAKREADGSVSVNMGLPEIEWQKIPLLKDVDTLFLPIPGKPTKNLVKHLAKNQVNQVDKNVPKR